MGGLPALGGDRPGGAGAGERADQGRAPVAVRGDREAGAVEGRAGGVVVAADYGGAPAGLPGGGGGRGGPAGGGGWVSVSLLNVS